jgi:hypothetical protein
MDNHPPFMAITSTGGYIGRVYWTNSGVHPEMPRWGSNVFIRQGALDNGMSAWASEVPIFRRVINWRF